MGSRTGARGRGPWWAGIILALTGLIAVLGVYTLSLRNRAALASG